MCFATGMQYRWIQQQEAVLGMYTVDISMD